MSEPGPPASTGVSTGTAVSSGPAGSFTTTATTTTAANSNTLTASSTTTAATITLTTPATTAFVSSTISSSTTPTSATTTARQAVPQISVYSGIPDRQTVQVIQQAFHRQPNTAAQYLQQMYAAQQQHLMLQTAALQQQHSLQSLAAVQQASIAAGRQNSSQNGTSTQQSGSTQTTINLTTSPAAAQLISRAQSITSTPSSISQQAVLLGSPSSSTLTASQAQMYLRAQMAQQSNVFQAQQSNLVQVARSLGRAVPLSPQLIFTPTATVTAVQSESSTQASSQNQVQNLAIRGQQVATTSSCQTQTLQALSLKQTPVPIQPASLIKHPGQLSAGGKPGSSESPCSEGGKKADVTEARAINMSRNVTTLGAQPLLAPAYTQIQPHALVQQHKQQQFVVHQSQSSQRTAGQLLQTASIQPSQHPVPMLPKPAPHQPLTPGQQATIFHSTISGHALHATPAPCSSSSSSLVNAQPVQLTAINLQIQPTASRMLQDCKEKPTSLVVRETCAASTTPQQQQQKPPPLPPPLPAPLPPPPKQQQSAPTPSPPAKPVEQAKSDPTTPAGQPQAEAATKRPAAAAGAPLPVVTSGSESVTATAQHNGENKLPQAIVKPQVLTHVIEGFVIQEGAEPFPVCVERLPILMDSPKKMDSQLSSDPDKTPVSNAANSDSEAEDLNPPEHEQEPKLTCEYCGWVDFAYTFKGSKRFCSMVCAKRYNVGCTKRIGLFRPEKTKATSRWRRRSQTRSSTEAKKRMSPSPQQTAGGSVSSPQPSQPSQEESSPCSDMSSYEGPPSPLSAASSGPPAPPAPAPLPVQRRPARASSEQDTTTCQPAVANDPARWNVEEVYQFICSLPGCQEIAEEFRSQEIDGQALLLLKEDHLMSTMNIKLGPALKIFASINLLKDS
ncbi:polyhomeotic-like protein 2b isoform X3 [Nerophis lumbriciformis]|uniref:polyhomeotic-like protein 2b isoform X3 n=1 Tax=Nerophis lumbriciformis TaxID=546530 RepID=UPI002ADF65BD|nr:polyhomeotic-like protein 2 isoform X3 [Nerophis lumbriciformis]